jgi:hypothetical protein
MLQLLLHKPQFGLTEHTALSVKQTSSRPMQALQLNTADQQLSNNVGQSLLLHLQQQAVLLLSRCMPHW